MTREELQTRINNKQAEIEKWDQWDAWKQERIKESEPHGIGNEYREWCHQMREKWGQGWREFRYLTRDQIHKANVTAADNIVNNLVNRTSELCGTITDAKGLYLDSDNQG